MKKLIPLLGLFIGACSGFGQGTVTFANNVGFTTPDPTGGGRLVYDVGSVVNTNGGVRLVGTQYVAELYFGPNAGSLTPLPATIWRFRSSTTTQRGTWNALVPTAVLPGVNIGDTTTLMVKVWDTTAGETYEATLGRGITGTSDPFNYTVPPPNSSCCAYFMEGLRAFALVPEPSAITMGVIGAAGLLLLRRRS